MRKLILLCGILLFTVISCKETAKEEEKVVEIEVQTETAELKDHHCSEACFEAEECVFVHGEKGHTCDASCKS